jgi:broad specificity phosphatase PhoE
MLVRHAESPWNAERRFSGPEASLTARGRLQAELSARALASLEVGAVYTSPLGCARDTAEIIAKPHRLGVLEEPAFGDASFGRCEGLTVEEVGQAFPELLRGWRADPDSARFPGGESLAIVAGRALGGIERLRALHQNETVVVVSHGIVVRLVVLHALGLSRDRLWMLHATPAGITEIEYRAGRATLHRINTTQHLEDPGWPREP